MSRAVTDLARDTGAIVADSLLSRGPPPWARELGEPNRAVVLSIVLLGVTVLLLGVAVLLLWRRQTGDPSPAESERTDAGQPDESTEVSELDRIKQIDDTVSGRLPQQEIVEQTDWSEAKVSRVVSRLAEDGQLEKIRIGRQNFIQINAEDSTRGESENRPAA